MTTLRVANRAYLERWEPDADDPERWYRPEHVAAWINDGNQRFAILDDGDLAGMVSLTGIELGGLRSAMISYFVRRAFTPAEFSELVTRALAGTKARFSLDASFFRSRQVIDIRY